MTKVEKEKQEQWTEWIHWKDLPAFLRSKGYIFHHDKDFATNSDEFRKYFLDWQLYADCGLHLISEKYYDVNIMNRNKPWLKHKRHTKAFS